MKWFTADQHFGHANILKYCPRPFDDVEEMNGDLVESYNATIPTIVTPVWWLGDVAMGDADVTLTYAAACQGQKTLIVGNHDRVFRRPGAKRPPNPRWDQMYRAVGFGTIHHATVTLTLQNGVNVRVSHFPYEGDSHDGDRFESLRPVDNGRWLLHGHVHEKWRQRGRQINVGVDAWAGRPVSADQICELIAAGPRDLDPLPWTRS